MKKTIALVSSIAPLTKEFCEEFEVITLPPDREIDSPVSTHPDMICTIIGERIFFPQSYAKENEATVKKIEELSGLHAVYTSGERGKKYPLDVSLNTAVIKNALLCRKASCAAELLEYASQLGSHVINTKQGYAGCSCIVCDDKVVTSDVGIFEVLDKIGIEVKLNREKIILDGYNCGFIGGCGGFFDGRVYLFGESEEDFFGCEKVSLAKGTLRDFGGIKFIKITKGE